MRLAICLHDGFFGCGTGAGLQNWRFLQCLTLSSHLVDELYVLPVHLVPESSEYDAAGHDRVRRLLAELPARIIPLDNGTGGKRRYGSLAEWQRVSAAAAHQLRRLADEPLAVVSFDTPFVGLLSALLDEPRVHHVHVPRSTALIHNPRDEARVAWEREDYQLADGQHALLGAISRFMRDHLVDDYGAQLEAVVDVFDGASRFEWSEEPVAPPSGLIQGPFILCLGRAVPYKGQHVLVEALGQLKREGVELPRAVIAAVSEVSSNLYADELERRCREWGLDAIVVRQFSWWLRDLIGHPLLRVVVVPSLVEPFGRIPLECYTSHSFQGVVVASMAGGLVETVRPGETGIGYKLHSWESLAQALQKALACPRHGRLALKERGLALIASQYDYEESVRHLLDGLHLYSRGASQA